MPLFDTFIARSYRPKIPSHFLIKCNTALGQWCLMKSMMAITQASTC